MTESKILLKTYLKTKWRESIEYACIFVVVTGYILASEQLFDKWRNDNESCILHNVAKYTLNWTDRITRLAPALWYIVYHTQTHCHQPNNSNTTKQIEDLLWTWTWTAHSIKKYKWLTMREREKKIEQKRWKCINRQSFFFSNCLVQLTIVHRLYMPLHTNDGLRLLFFLSIRFVDSVLLPETIVVHSRK